MTVSVRAMLLKAVEQVARARAARDHRVVHKNEVIEVALLGDPDIAKEYKRLRREATK